MTNKTTKSALFTSSISLLLCFAMLLGTTFAWFTDSVTSANNIIKSGNLDVEFEYWNGSTWETVQGASDILSYDLWEPGVTEVAYLRVKNEGSLALKYQLGVNIVSEKEGTNVAGDTFKLSDSLMFGMIEDKNGENDAFSKDDAGRAAAIAAVTDAKKINQAYSKEFDMASGDPEEYFALVVYMPTTVGNEANHNGSDIPQIDLGINVFATQLENEEDSFNNQYDGGSVYPETKTVTVPENNTADVEISAGSLTVTVPAEDATAGEDYKIVVSNTNTTTDSATGETSVGFDLTMYKDDVKVSSGSTIYEVAWNVGAGKIISEVKHNGTALTNADTGADQTYKYDSATGELTIYTASFSPFEITYKEYEEYEVKLNRGHNVNSSISVSTGSDFLPMVAVNPTIAGYSVFDGNTRITDAVKFRFSNVAKTINGDTCTVSFNLAVKDADGNDLTIKEGKFNPFINTDLREYIWVYVNLIDALTTDGYSVSSVKVNGTSLEKSTGDYAPTNGYLIGSDGIYFQSTAAGAIEITLTK